MAHRSVRRVSDLYKPGDLNLIPGTHNGWRNQLLNVVLFPPYAYSYFSLSLILKKACARSGMVVHFCSFTLHPSRLENFRCKFKVNLNYTERPYLKKDLVLTHSSILKHVTCLHTTALYMVLKTRQILEGLRSIKVNPL